MFHHILPPSRLGQSLDSLEAFRAATSVQQSKSSKVEEFSMVVVTESESVNHQRILLGQRHRGFGKRLYTSFGGKKEALESVEECACRELQKETSIQIPLHVMEQSLVGSMHYTFEDLKDFLMLCHVFHVDIDFQVKPREGGTRHISLDVQIDPCSIRGCEEITPNWFHSYSEIPFNNMFADDSLWLTQLLEAFSQGKRLAIDGWFHFLPGGQEVNSIRFYYMDIRPKSPFSLEKRLFHQLCCNRLHNTSVKEFKEAWAFCNAVKSLVGGKKQKPPLEVVIDVAGGHGALAALFLITTSATRAVVIDPAHVGGGAVERAWRRDFLRDKKLQYLHEDLRTGLPAELSNTLQNTDPERVLVVACHACQHLSEETLEIVRTQFPGVHAATMPCCQRDSSPGCAWKHTSKNLQIPVEKVMDLLLAGKVMSWQSGQHRQTGLYDYDVRMKVIDSNITPQNRIIVCKAVPRSGGSGGAQTTRGKDAAHQKLATTYARAHGVPGRSGQSPIQNVFPNLSPSQVGGVCGLIGFAAGLWVAGWPSHTRTR